MYRGCENCANNIYERGWEDYSQYCLKRIDMDNIPEKEENPNYKCEKWKKTIVK